MIKVITILISMIIISLISFGHWLVFYEFPNFARWTLWYVGFIAFMIPVLIINRVFISQKKLKRCFIVFSMLIIGQSIADLVLIKYYFEGNISDTYYFFLCMENSWEGNILLSCIPLFSSRVPTVSTRKEHEEVIDDVEW